jgi:Metallopeptidase family M24
MTVESERDLAGLRRVGRVVGLALREMKESLEPGITTGELDAVGARVFERHGARSAPQLMKGFPGVNCISVNDEAVHGVPGGRTIEPGDLVKIDVTAELDGYVADAAVTVAVPQGPSVHDELRGARLRAGCRRSAGRTTHQQDRARRRDGGPPQGLHRALRAQQPRGREVHPRAADDPQLLRAASVRPAPRGAGHNHRADRLLRLRLDGRGGRRLDDQDLRREPGRPPRAHHRRDEGPASRAHGGVNSSPCVVLDAGRALGASWRRSRHPAYPGAGH